MFSKFSFALGKLFLHSCQMCFGELPILGSIGKTASTRLSHPYWSVNGNTLDVTNYAVSSSGSNKKNLKLKRRIKWSEP
jgi:hypothetical protein